MKLALAKSLLKSFYKSFVKIGFTYLLESVEKWTLKNTIQFIKKYIKSYPITIILFFIMTVIHLLAYMIGNGPSDHETARKLGALLSVNKDVSEYPYLLTSIYQHIGGMKHYFGNMVGLLIFAPFLEKAYGAIKFTLLFHFTGIIGACCQLYLTSHSISSGASGGLSGMLGVYFALILKRSRIMGWYLKILSILFFISWIIDTFTITNVSIAAHIGGLVSGFLLGLVVSPNNTYRIHYFQSMLKYALLTVGIWCLLFSLRFSNDSMKKYFENPFGIYDLNIPMFQELSLHNNVFFLGKLFDQYAVNYYNTFTDVYSERIKVDKIELLQMKEELQSQIKELNSKKIDDETEKAHALLNEILIGNLTINEYLVSYIETNDINIKIKLLQEFKKTYQKMDEFVIEFKPLYEKVN